MYAVRSLLPSVAAATGVAAILLSPKLASASPTNITTRQTPWSTNTTSTTTTLTVELGTRYQEMDGFGISEAFQRAYNIYDLEEPKRSQLVDLLFNATAGAGFTILRSGVGSSPSSDQDWMNTILPKAPASPDAEPEYVWDGKDSGQLWVAQQAAKYGVKTFYGDAWSAPGFMKTNGKDSNGGSLCGVPGATCTSGDWRQAYANYLVKYIQLYQENGIDVTHIGFVNEPDISTSYASMQSTGEQSANFVKVLHPTLEKAGLGNVSITCCEATGWRAQSQMTLALRDAGIEDLVGVITGHTYTSGITGPQPTSRKSWVSECADLSGHWSTTWDTPGGSGDGLTWANNIYTGLTTGNLSAYLWWVGTQDKATNNNNNEKLILVDNGDYEVSKRFWAFAQYSRIIRPKAVRVDISAGNNSEGLLPTAFVNADGSVAVHIINSGLAATNLTIDGVKGAAVARAWITDNNNDLTEIPLTIGGGGVVRGVSVPARGLVGVLISQAVSR